VILDTAGRLHVDAEMMEELVRTKAAARPHEILLVLDSMTGQDAALVAAEFNSKLGLTGAILTKLDSDARGGAALSLRAVSGAAIKYVGTGEKLADLEEFHPERMASRILGMGDIVTLAEKAQAAFDSKEAAWLEERARKDRMTLEDFAEQLRQVKKMGSLQDLAGMIPGMPKAATAEIDEKAFSRMEAIIGSMTPKERRNPQVFNGSRRQRVARGSGTSVQEVNQLLRQFEAAQKLMKMAARGKGRRMQLPLGMQ
ncbi:MAG TPA: signal recognition particle protein, partial [candidate division Zixibacteria bacterium]|nr:signal recognition particle protein [candidate division Zixibacteria bacterium]